jgi:hypothetical protein
VGVLSPSPPILPPDDIDGPEGLRHLLAELRHTVYRTAKRATVKDIPALNGLLATAVQYERLVTTPRGYEAPPQFEIISSVPRPPPEQPTDCPPPLQNTPETAIPPTDGQPRPPTPTQPEEALAPVLCNFCPACGFPRPAYNRDRCPQCKAFYTEDARRTAFIADAEAHAETVGGTVSLDDGKWRPVRDGETIAGALARQDEDI